MAIRKADERLTLNIVENRKSDTNDCGGFKVSSDEFAVSDTAAGGGSTIGYITSSAARSSIYFVPRTSSSVLVFTTALSAHFVILNRDEGFQQTTRGGFR